MNRCPTHASLFSGIGGFDLAAEWTGFENKFNCDTDPFCRRVLEYHFPYAKQYTDICTTDFSVWRDCIDVLSGGFPCQPFSSAGKRRGTADDRYLWPQMLRAVREVRPRWVVGENVLGIVSWSQGLVFEQVCADLETEGYSVQPYVLPACGVDAPHRRYRTWFVAHLADGSDARSENMPKRTDGAAAVEFTADTDSQRRTRRDTKSGGTDSNAAFRTNFFGLLERPGRKRSTADTSRFENTGRRPGRLTARSAGIAGSECAPDAQSGRFAQRDAKSHRSVLYAATQRNDSIPGWDDFPTQPPVRGGDDGLPEQLDPAAVFAGLDERQHRRRSHVVRWCTEAIKCYGNAIVPQVAYRILMTIYRYESRIAE